MMASEVPIVLSDDEEGPPAPADGPPLGDGAAPVTGPSPDAAAGGYTPHSSEEFDYSAAADEVDLNNVSLHESDIEEGDIFAENLQREEEFLANLLATPPAAAVRRSPPKTRRGRTLDMSAPEVLQETPPVVCDSPPVPVEDPPEPEPVGATFTARVLAGQLVIRLQMKRSDRLQRLFDAVADELSLPAQRVCLGQRDVIYSPHQTPDDVALGPFDMIEFWEVSSARAAPVAPAVPQPVDPDSIELKVQSAERRGAVTVRLARTEPMSVLMERYARQKGAELAKLRFRFDGEALDPSDTPETLDLEGGECVDVHSC
ncbi:NFATC2-interacting protein [Amphibalanus amphitrite]|uniref:NFATC2-interacting protein n=1 Tax=Amphibalanus amphitrite TaxID=1232801 RepID=A0A6A4WDC8_AMPAM|nr:NFATC2-interacting protein [Amphibalanus amphitrite]